MPLRPASAVRKPSPVVSPGRPSGTLPTSPTCRDSGERGVGRGGARSNEPRRVSGPRRLPAIPKHAHDPSRDHLRRLHAAPERACRSARPFRRVPPAHACLGTARRGQIDDRPADRRGRQPPVCRRPRAAARPRFSSPADLRRAAELRPHLYRRYAETEQRIGHTLSPSGIPLPELTGISPVSGRDDPTGLERA